jgi:hypothetical protein
MEVVMAQDTSPAGRAMLPARSFTLLAASAAALGMMATAHAAVTSIAVTGYNQDVIVEAGAPLNATGVTTASMDNGLGGTGGVWYEQGYNAGSPLTGVPAKGTTIISSSAADHSYTFASSYGPGNGSAGTTNDAFVVGQNTGAPTISLATASAYSLISFLASAGHGPNTVNFVINFADSSTQSGSFVVADWFNGATNLAYTTNGRTSVNTGSFDNVNNNNPRIYSYDVTVTNTTSAITSISLSSASTTSTASIFALSGTAVPEPSSMILGATGLLFAAGLRRRR